MFSRMDLWGYCVHNPSLKRFFLFHFQLPFLACGFVILHLFYLHFLSSNNPLRNSTNNKIPFFSFFIFFKLISGSLLSHIQTMHQKLVHYLLLYIVPEWYFLCQYAMLKAVPNKNAGFIILLTSIFILFYFGES